MKYTFLILILSSILCSCSNRNMVDGEDGDTLKLRHARLVMAIKYDDRLRIDIRNPWDSTAILRSICVNTPIKRAAVYTATHAALLAELGATGSIGGLFDTKYIQNPKIREALAQGQIHDLGLSNGISLERVMDLQPDLLMPSPYESQVGYGRLEQMGIPIMECADYMEVSPLARAEWIRIYGALFGVGERADSLFAEIEKRYLDLKKIASTSPKRPKLLTERPLSGTWHVPCGGSATGQLYKDAAAEYLFADIPGSGATALSIEMVMDRGMQADYWLIKSFGPLSKENLINDCPAIRHIPARLLVCDTEKIPFFEETPFHPEYLLENLISLFHPELGIKAHRAYFEK